MTKANRSFLGNVERTQRVVMAASELSGIDGRMITGPRRHRHLAEIRFAIMHALHRADMPKIQIAMHLGGRDHVTVIRGLERAEYLIACDKDYAAFTAKLEKVALA